jgi:hypothetical protein
MKFEHRTAPVIPHAAFLRRLLNSAAVALSITALSLALGMLGYHALEGMAWIDAFLNAAMILGGMGEIDALRTSGGKVFAGLYALYSGLWVVASMGIILAPVFHRVLHRFHAEKS